MITVKASQKFFTFAEVAKLTGICAEHLESLTKRHRLGFVRRPVGLDGFGDVVPALCPLRSAIAQRFLQSFTL